MPNGAAAAIAAADSIDTARKHFREAKLELLKAKVVLDDTALHEGRTEAEKTQAILKSLQLSPTILQIENAQIAALADRVEANAKKLTKATGDLRETLNRVDKVKDVIKAVDKLLQVVAVILAL